MYLKLLVGLELLEIERLGFHHFKMVEVQLEVIDLLRRLVILVMVG